MGDGMLSDSAGSVMGADRAVGGAAPLVWLLTGDKAGDNAQLRVLADTLAWPWQSKTVVTNGFYRLPNWLLGGRLWSYDRRHSTPLTPPWPDLVLASGRRAVPIARWIRRQSLGRARLVHLGRPWAPFRWFDLIIGMPQYGLPDAANLLRAGLPLNRIAPERLAAGAAALAPRLAGLPRPLTTALIGGPNRNARLDADSARRLGRDLSAHVASRGGSLLISTSRRTPPAVTAALQQAVSVPAEIYAYRADDPANPHLGFIALADDLVVTSDSASMIAEACRTGKAVSVALLPTPAELRPSVLNRLGAKLPRALRNQLLRRGVLVGERDVAGLAAVLAERGVVRLLGRPGMATQAVPDDLPVIVARIQGLFGG